MNRAYSGACLLVGWSENGKEGRRGGECLLGGGINRGRVVLSGTGKGEPAINREVAEIRKTSMWSCERTRRFL